MTTLAIHPLTPDRWNDFVQLFETDSMCRMCWCLGHRLPAAVRRKMKDDVRKKHMAKLVKAGPPPGLLAYRDGDAVGWLAIAPRPQTPEFNTGRKSSAVVNADDAEDPRVWAATCFFVRKDARGTGVTGQLLEAGAAWARGNGASRLDACPMSHDEKRSTAGMFVGPKRVFERQGFETVIERKPGRPLMRLHLDKRAKTVAKPALSARSGTGPAPRKPAK